MYETRKKFLEEVMRRTGLRSLEEAGRIVEVVIGLIKARIGPELSEKVADAVPLDLAKGWRAIALPSEAMELQEMMFELEEVAEESAPLEETGPAEYG